GCLFSSVYPWSRLTRACIRAHFEVGAGVHNLEIQMTCFRGSLRERKRWMLLHNSLSVIYKSFQMNMKH
ncbi:hypothetical protein MKX01_038148, partial [Papaver californicum]